MLETIGIWIYLFFLYTSQPKKLPVLTVEGGWQTAFKRETKKSCIFEEQIDINNLISLG